MYAEVYVFLNGFHNCVINWSANSVVLVEYGLVLCAMTLVWLCEMIGWCYLFWASGRHLEQ